jgi:multidrug transporter EmrE-like cation transporter
MRSLHYLYLLGTIAFTVYGQLIIKWRIGNYGHLPEEMNKKIFFLFKLFLDPFILSGFIAALFASVFWMAAITKFEVSYAYPFVSLAFVAVLLLSTVLFNEPLTVHKIVGLSFIVLGIYISSQSA